MIQTTVVLKIKSSFGRMTQRPALLAGILLILLAAILYGATLDNGVRLGELMGGDLITHHYAQVEGRPANAPGYPIHTMLGWVWFRVGRFLLPWLNATQILSLLSTLFALAALGVFYLLLLEVTNHWAIAVSVSSFYAVTYFFWYYAVTSEQYASSVLQTLLFVLWAFRWQRSRADRYLLYTALNIGLSLSNLVTVLFIIPPLAVFYLIEAPELIRRGRLLLRMIALVVMPLFSYTFIFLAGLAHPEWRGAGEWPSIWAWFTSFLSTAQGRSELTWDLRGSMAGFPLLIAHELTWGVLIISLIGIWFLGRRRAGLIYFALIIYLLFSYIDRYGNWYQVFLPMYPLLLLGFAAALNAIWGYLQDRRVRVAQGVLLAGLLAMVFAQFRVNLPRVDQSNRPDDNAIPLALALIADNPVHGGLIYGTRDEIAALSYLTRIWGVRPDLQPVITGEAERWLHLNDPRTLYVTKEAIQLFESELGASPSLSSAGRHLIEVLREPRTSLPPDVAVVGQVIVPGLVLAGVSHDISEGFLQVTLYWQATDALEPMVVSVRPTRAGDLLRVDGQLLAQDHQPVWNVYSFDRWTPGEVVRDDYVLSLPAGTSPEGLRILLYRITPTSTEVIATIEIPLPS